MSAIPDSLTTWFRPPALAYVATIGPKGEPQVSPVLFDWDGKYLRFSMNRIRQKRRNLERDPRIALSITDPDDAFTTVEIRGVVVRIENDEDYAFINHLSENYFGHDATGDLLPGEERVTVVIEPQKAYGFTPAAHAR
ncbi:MAG: PPOX class F420-dependent oxidoreductase [Thermomicrobiales bacterium]